MLPVLVGYMGAYAETTPWQVFRQTAMFIVGISLVMTALGVIASLMGLTFGSLVGPAWYYLTGGGAILIALQMLHLIHIPLPKFITRLPDTRAGHWLSPLVLGIAFGAASSPCGTPFLAAILLFISQQHNLPLGAVSLFSYALGQGVLFLLVGLFTGLLHHMAVMRRVGPVLTRLSAMLFMIMGLMLIAVGAGWLPAILSALQLSP
jgi:cytochrome c-type biogenesis protein